MLENVKWPVKVHYVVCQWTFRVGKACGVEPGTNPVPKAIWHTLFEQPLESLFMFSRIARSNYQQYGSHSMSNEQLDEWFFALLGMYFRRTEQVYDAAHGDPEVAARLLLLGLV